MSRLSFPEGGTAERRRTVVAAYDVVDDARRERVANVLLYYGVRVQYSVFECSLTGPERREVLERLRGVIDPAEDAVSLYLLCRPCSGRVRRLGRPPPEPNPQYRIL